MSKITDLLKKGGLGKEMGAPHDEWLDNSPEVQKTALDMVMNREVPEGEEINTPRTVEQAIEHNMNSPQEHIELPEKPEVVDISLRTHAILSHLNIRRWRGKKKDTQATKDYALQTNANPKKLSLDKHLLSDNEHLQNIARIDQDARSAHDRLGKPWMGRGGKVVPATAIFETQEIFSRLGAEFYSEVDLFFDGYEEAVDDAELEAANSSKGLGDLFDRSDYPDVYTLREKFEFVWAPLPLAEGSIDDWRLDIADEQKEYLQESYKKFYDLRTQEMMDRVYSEATEKLNDLRDKLDYPQGGKPKGFHTSLVDRALDLVQMLRHFNLTHDPSIETARLGLEQALQGVTAEALRDSERLRNEVITAAKRVMNALPTSSTTITV